MLVSSAFSYDVVPVLRPFVSGYMERQMSDTVLEDMDLANTDLSYEDILAGDPALRHEFCTASYESVGIWGDAADQMATEAEEYADANGAQVSEAVIEVLCERLCFVAGVTLLFLIFLIASWPLRTYRTYLTAYRTWTSERRRRGGHGLHKRRVLLLPHRLAAALPGPHNRHGHLQSTLLARFFHTIDLITAGVGI